MNDFLRISGILSSGVYAWLVLVLLIGSVNGFAQNPSGIRVIEETAIPYTGFLSKANFDRRFPGQWKSGPDELDRGWYVIYAHEHLNYYFGPILLESTGKDYLAQLTRIVEAAVLQRPSITVYRLELSFEPSLLPSSSGSKHAESEIGTDSPPPSATFNIWNLVRRIFGL